MRSRERERATKMRVVDQHERAQKEDKGNTKRARERKGTEGESSRHKNRPAACVQVCGGAAHLLLLHLKPGSNHNRIMHVFQKW